MKKIPRWLRLCAGIIVLILAAALVVRPPTQATGLDNANSQPAPALTDATATTPKRILVIGASSGIGLVTAQLAAARGHAVTAMSRSGVPTSGVNPQVIKGDILDAATVIQATADIDAVVLSISAKPGRQPIEVFSQGMRNVLAALAARPQVQIIVVTGIGAGDSRGHGGFGYDRILTPLMMEQIYQDKSRQEALLKASPARFTIVRPGFLTNDTLDTPYRAALNLDGVRSGAISRAQVAQFIVAVIEQETYSRETLLLSR
jgi:putative NADH-flavin reductase